MSIVLVKGQKIDLTKGNAGLNKLRIGLGWDPKDPNGPSADLDAVVYMLDGNSKGLNNSSLIYFGNLQGPGVNHQGDNLTGDGDGDDEVIEITLDQLPEGVERLAFAVTIYGGKSKGQNFGQIANSFIRVVDDSNDTELMKFDLGEDFSTELSVIAGEIYKHNGEWKFNALGEGFPGELGELNSKYGL